MNRVARLIGIGSLVLIGGGVGGVIATGVIANGGAHPAAAQKVAVAQRSNYSTPRTDRTPTTIPTPTSKHTPAPTTTTTATAPDSTPTTTTVVAPTTTTTAPAPTTTTTAELVQIVIVPDVIGLGQGHAQDEIKAAGLEYQEAPGGISTWKCPLGTPITYADTETPAAGTRVKAGTVVEVTINPFPPGTDGGIEACTIPPTAVPNLVGESNLDATNKLEALDLYGGTSAYGSFGDGYVYCNDIGTFSATVIAQSIPAGTVETSSANSVILTAACPPGDGHS